MANMTREDIAKALSEAQRGHGAACDSFRRILHLALPRIEQLGQEKNSFSPRLMQLMHDRARATMPDVVHEGCGRELERLCEAESVLARLIDESREASVEDPTGLSSRAAELSSTFTGISANVEGLLRRW
jgi:hypothetical protein